MEAQDHMNLAGDRGFSKALGGNESLLLSCKVTKFNKRNRAQERTIVVTSRAILNLKGKKIQRRIELEGVIGATKSKHSDEFIVHCPGEYDYRFSSQLKDQIVSLLVKTAKALNGKTLYIWETQELNLKDLATTKADRKKGLSKIPSPESAVNFRTGPVEEEKKEHKIKRSQTIYAAKGDSGEVTLNDFNMLKVLGRGSFGKVMLVQKKDTKALYAMKSLRKDALLEREQIEHTKTEKMIMEHVNHPFLVSLEYAFTTPGKIYFVMGFMKGGELFFHLKESRKFTEERAKFYAAQIGLGLGHLHSKNIVYRDLKPENILMDELGNVYLTDFGMAKMLPEGESTMSFVGTPEYLAPEIIACTGHNIMADWWSFGILIYEMMVGIPPFYNQNIQLMYELIQHGELRFPQRNPLSREAQDIITKLLERDPTRRLGARGIEEIKSHPYFEGINWTLIEQKKLPTPFQPRISNAMSTENFDREFTSEEPINSVVPENKLRFVAQNADQFDDF
jgi:serum/glucocorticoid-regulated kinase 2